MNFKDVWILLKESVSAWVDDYAPSMGAALAYYTLFSIAPLLLIVIAIAGFFFGAEAAQGEILTQLRGLIGDEGALAVQGLLKSASQPGHRALATFIGVFTLVLGATTVFSELQSALDRIWRAPALKEQSSGIWTLIRTRLLSLGMVLGIGFLLLVSLVLSAVLSALGKWWGGLFGGWEVLLQLINFVVSFAIITGLFAMIYKILPRVKIDWHDVWIGAAVTALLFTIGKFAIGLYLGKSAVASGFGAAGSFVVLLIWVYYSAQIFLLGAEFTWVYAHQHGSRTAEPRPGPTPAVPRRFEETPSDMAEERLARGIPTTAHSAPAAVPVANMRHQGAVAQAQEFIRENPVKGLGMVATLGLILGGILRQIAPPTRFLARTGRARWIAAKPAELGRRIARAPAKIQAHIERAKKPSLLHKMIGRWRARSRRSLSRELMLAVTAHLLANRFVRKRVAQKKDSLARRLLGSLAEHWAQNDRRLSH
jgi:membrane protein